MGIDKRQRYLKDFIKLARIGSKYYVMGAPDGQEGPYDHPSEAEDVYNDIIDNFMDYEVVNRKIVKKTETEPEDYS